MTNTKLCIACGKELPIDAFMNNYKSPDGHQHICRDCKRERKATKKTNMGGGGNPKLADFKPRELIEELRYRGYTGTLEYVHKITL